MISTIALSLSLKIGGITLVEGRDGVFLYPEKLHLILGVVSDFLGFPPPVLEDGKLLFNGNELSWKDGIYEFNGVRVEAEFFRMDNVLSAFGIPTVFEGGDVIVPECVIREVDLRSNRIEVMYSGNPAFIYKSTGESLVIVSTGFVFHDGVVKRPGEVIREFIVKGARISDIAEYTDRDVVTLSFKEIFRHLVFARFGEWRGRPVSPSDLLVLLSRGNGKVIVRPPSEDIGGLDLSAFERSWKIAERLSEYLGYDLEMCPLIDVPVGANAFVILTDDGTEMILDALDSVVDYSDIVDLTLR